jgi:hypothetical protein
MRRRMRDFWALREFSSPASNGQGEDQCGGGLGAEGNRWT